MSAAEHQTVEDLATEWLSLRDETTSLTAEDFQRRLTALAQRWSAVAHLQGYVSERIAGR